MEPRSDSPQQLERWKKKLMEKSGTFLAILVLNICILILLGSTVIYRLVISQINEPIAAYKIKPIPPPAKPPAHGGDTARTLADPTVAVVPPPVSLPSIVVSTASTSFNIKTSVAPTIGSSLPTFAVPSGNGLGHGTTGGGVPQSNPFGSSLDSGTPAMVGYFYDLKQSSDNPPVATGMTRPLWRKEMDRLVADDLNEADLSKYLKSPSPLSTNGFSIPEQSSKNAPVAFGLPNVQPNLWAIVYRAKVSIPEGGRYRFVGFGDDVLFVRIDKKVVFDGGWQPLSNDRELHERYPLKWSASVEGNPGLLKKGAWFNADAGDVKNIDILIGDWGGKCGFYLLLEKEGAKYEMSSDNITPKLPLFQVGAKLTFPAPGPEVPPLSDTGVVWPAVSDQL